jgi:4-alpha-glucanotransferase
VRDRLATDEIERNLTAPGLSPALHSAIVDALLTSGSSLVILPIQDLFGWRDRINQPATVGDQNWTWKLPWLVNTLPSQRHAIEVAARLRERVMQSGRSGKVEEVKK